MNVQLALDKVLGDVAERLVRLHHARRLSEALPRLAQELSRARSHVHLAGWYVTPDFALTRDGDRVELLNTRGLRPPVVYRKSSQPANRVLQQTPAPGSTLRRNSHVSAVVSAGRNPQPTAPVTTVVGQDQRFRRSRRLTGHDVRRALRRRIRHRRRVETCVWR